MQLKLSLIGISCTGKNTGLYQLTTGPQLNPLRINMGFNLRGNSLRR